jgi:hypothetical protein
LSFSEGVRKEPGAYLPDGLTKDAPKDAPKGGPGYVPKDATGDSPENEPDLALSFLSGYPDDDDDDDLESETSLPQDFGLETLIPVRPAEAPPPAALNGSQGKGGHGPEAALKLTPDGEVPTPNFVAKPPAEPESEKLIKSLNLPKVKSPSETALANWPPNDEGKKELLEDLLFIRGILARPVE